LRRWRSPSAEKLRISPVSVVIAIAVSSNLQGAATLVGDTTSILLGGYAGMISLISLCSSGGRHVLGRAGGCRRLRAHPAVYFRRQTRNISVDEHTPSRTISRRCHGGIVILLIWSRSCRISPRQQTASSAWGCFCRPPARRLYKKGFERAEKSALRYRLANDFMLSGLFVVIAASAGWALSTISAAVRAGGRRQSVFNLYADCLGLGVLLRLY
jgi:hypothetical protein